MESEEADMKRLYEIINDCNTNDKNVIATVVEGEYFGEKALFSKNKILFETTPDGFLKKHQKSITEMTKTDTYWFDNNRVFIEILSDMKKLVICGGGHVSIPLIKMGLMTGFSVTVLEDRPTFADNARRAGANNVICKPFDEGLAEVKGDKDTYFVIVTRGHRYDQICLENIIKKENAYIGMLGSKIRVKAVKGLLEEKGIAKDLLEKIYAPIGLKIGAETPEEIAICIMAEIIQVKSMMNRGSIYPKELLEAIMCDSKEYSAKVLATIVSRKGSAPRSTGTKMLILPDGKTFGTIGGGCTESKVIQKSLDMLSNDDVIPKLYKVYMTAKDAEDAGMICGGIIEVLLEKIM